MKSANSHHLKSVKSLTNKFDIRNQTIIRDSTNTATTEIIELKQVVNEQTKLITNLRGQLETKDRKIKELESHLKTLLKNIPATKLDLSLELNGHSLA